MTFEEDLQSGLTAIIFVCILVGIISGATDMLGDASFAPDQNIIPLQLFIIAGVLIAVLTLVCFRCENPCKKKEKEDFQPPGRKYRNFINQEMYEN